jgi:5-methylcytosine-specific restriction endonuclease McrA
MKNCSKCKEIKELKEFWKDSSTKDGFSCRCKKCDSKKTVEWGRNNRDKKAKNDRRFHVKSGYRKYKKSYCEQCGFVAVHSCQLDVDHTDGNHKNDNLENLRTLCSNCHRLKTYINKDFRHLKLRGDA